MITHEAIVKINEQLIKARAEGVPVSSFDLTGAEDLGFTDAETTRIEAFVKDGLARHNTALLDYIEGELVGINDDGQALIKEGDLHFEFEEQFDSNVTAGPQPSTENAKSPVSNEVAPASFGRDQATFDTAFGTVIDKDESYVFGGFATATNADEVFAALNQNKLVALPTTNEMSSFIAHMENKGASFNLQGLCDDKSGVFKVSGLSDHSSQMLMYLERAGDQAAPEIFSFTSDMAIVEIEGKFYLGSAGNDWDFTPANSLEISSLEGKGLNSVAMMRDFSDPKSDKENDEKYHNERRNPGPSIINFGRANKNGGAGSKKHSFFNREIDPGTMTSEYMNSQLQVAINALNEIKAKDVFDPGHKVVSELRDSINNMGATINNMGEMKKDFVGDEKLQDFFERYEQFSNDLRSFQSDLAKKGSGVLDLGKNILDTEAVKALSKALENAMSSLAAKFGGR